MVEYFKGKGGIAYINVLANISKSCDCAGVRAPEPKIRNIGILASTDPVAIDKACYDLIVKENTEGSKDLIKQAQSKLGLNLEGGKYILNASYLPGNNLINTALRIHNHLIDTVIDKIKEELK